MNKRCSKCGIFKSLDNFCKDKSRKDGLYPRCKACLSKYYEKSKKRIHEYLQENKEYISGRQKKYLKDNKETVAKQRAGYRKENREALHEYAVEYCEKNRGRMCALWAKRRALKQLAVDANLKLVQKYYDICQRINDILGDKIFCVDHIQPLSRGGLHHEDNLQILKCNLNQKKYNKWPLSDSEHLEYAGIILQKRSRYA